jgi:hypothetical protein
MENGIDIATPEDIHRRITATSGQFVGIVDLQLRVFHSRAASLRSLRTSPFSACEERSFRRADKSTSYAASPVSVLVNSMVVLSVLSSRAMSTFLLFVTATSC